MNNKLEGKGRRKKKNFVLNSSKKKVKWSTGEGKNNIDREFKEPGCETLRWIEVTQDLFQLHFLILALGNLRNLIQCLFRIIIS